MKKLFKATLVVLISVFAVIGIAGAATTIGDQIVLTGTGTTGIDLSGATLTTSDITLQNGEVISNATDGTVDISGKINLSGALESALTNPLFSIGTITTAKSAALTDSAVPVQVNLSSSADASGTLAGMYMKSANTTTTATPNLQLAGALTRVMLNNTFDSAYGVQSHVGTGAAVATNVSNANIAAISGKIDADHAITQGQVEAGLFIIEGDGAITETSSGIMISAEAGADINNLIWANTDGLSTATNGINFDQASITNDIVLQNGEVISNDTDGTIDFGAANLATTGMINQTATPAAGADIGNVFKTTLAAAGTYTGTTGYKFKVYDEDATVVHSGGEHAAVYANMKLLSAMTGGGKSVLYSGHNYDNANEAIDAGVWLYGNIVDAFKISGGSSTDGLDLSEQTITGADVKTSAGTSMLSGAGTSRAEVRADGGDTATIGSVYFSTAGKMYIKVANTTADTDWELVTTSAAD